MKQYSLFNEEAFKNDEPRTMSAIARSITLLKEELKVGEWDYDRLLPSLPDYERIVKRYRGVVNFKYRDNKYEAMEARNVCRFMRTWKARAGWLIETIETLEAEYRKRQ